ncbi:MAG: hypothetical protein HQ522_20290 [Bacteroidetes bacterium]|nr:hypothetical protein [Bacteroidota bacterium]
MSADSEAKKRDFVSQTITIMEQNTTTLSDAGFAPENRITQLKTELLATDEAEGRQNEAQAAALDATKAANNTLKIAYNDASAAISLIEGLLGKDNSLVHKLRQLRK